MNKEKEVPFWRKGEFYLVVFLFAIIMFFVISAIGFPRISRIFPLLVGSVALILLSGDILQFLVPGFGRWFRSFRGGEVFEHYKTQAMIEDRGKPTEEPQIVRPISILITSLWFYGAFIAFYFLGYLLALVLFLSLFFRFYASLSVKKSAAITASIALILWVLFSTFLKLDIFAGSALLYGLF